MSQVPEPNVVPMPEPSKLGRKAVITIQELDPKGEEVNFHLHFDPPVLTQAEAAASSAAKLASIAFHAVNAALGVTEIPGICAKCGCTDDHPCEGGCSWANEKHTICSRCVDEGDGPRIVTPGGDPAGEERRIIIP